MKPFALMDRRVRGFRVVEIGAACILLVLVLVVYLAKTHAGGERTTIDQVQAQIDEEQDRIRMLRAEVASLEQPERLETLAGRYLNLQPIPAKHEVGPESLADIVHPPAPAAKAAPTAAPTAAPASGQAAAPASAAADEGDAASEGDPSAGAH